MRGDGDDPLAFDAMVAFPGFWRRGQWSTGTRWDVSRRVIITRTTRCRLPLGTADTGQIRDCGHGLLRLGSALRVLGVRS